MNKEIYTVAEFKKEFGKVKVVGKIRGKMNGLERDFVNSILEPRRLAKESNGWSYCEITGKRFIIGEIIVKGRKKTLHYTPDFEEEGIDGELTYYETKGHNYPEAWLRFRIAVATHSGISFFFVKRLKDRWVMTEYRSNPK